MKTLGTKIAEYRKLNKMTQEDLASKLNISAQAVSKWENDLSIPDLPILIELSDMFQVTLDELVRNDKEVPTRYVEEPMRKPIKHMMIKVNVYSDGDVIKINLPLALIKAGLELTQINNNDLLKGIDFNEVLNIVELGVVGKILELDSSDGDHIEIIVE